LIRTAEVKVANSNIATDNNMTSDEFGTSCGPLRNKMMSKNVLRSSCRVLSQ